MLLMHRFGTLNTLVPGHYILRQLICLSRILYIDWPWNTNINENTQPPVNCEMAAKYSATFFVNTVEYMYIIELMQC